MADFSFNASAGLHSPKTSYDGRGGDLETVELTALPRSRAPSYLSSNRSFFRADDDHEELIKDGLSLKREDETVVRSLSQTTENTVNREKRRKLQGWRFGVTVSAWLASSVLMINFIFLIVGVAKFHDTLDEGVGTAINGNCDKVDGWATWTHIIINGLSSLLLSASNYTMQAISSPTRADIQRAHSKGDWMDIGVASVRNIFGRISWQRASVWWLLALSSIPIHLLYNSAVFKSIDANWYDVLVVNENWLKGDPFATNIPNNGSTLRNWGNAQASGLRKTQINFSENLTNSSVIQNLTNIDCMSTYGRNYISGRDTVVLVTSQEDPIANHTYFDSITDSIWGPGANSYWWICADMKGYEYISNCDVSSAKANVTNWTVSGYKIDYCLSHLSRPHCKLQFSTTIVAVVILMNACKAACMFWTLWRHKESPLVTFGDAVASFLSTEDEFTKGRCLMSKADVNKGPLHWRLKGTTKPNTRALPQNYYSSQRRRWFAAASTKRWLMTMSLCMSALIAASGLLGAATSATQQWLVAGETPFSIGFGTIDSRAIISTDGLPQKGASGLVSSVLLANLPQAICSFLYLAYNGLYTSMLLSSEWSRYFTTSKKPLRVTTPHGLQRSTYYLQLPYKYSAPLLIASATLHWLISESIFLARIDMWYKGSLVEQASASEVGYSCLPILLVILLGIAMLTVAIGNGFRKFHSPMPVAGSCSVAISAACHPPKDDVDAAYLPVSWGEIDQNDDGAVFHCCFSSFDTHDLMPGRMYAGKDKSLHNNDSSALSSSTTKPTTRARLKWN